MIFYILFFIFSTLSLPNCFGSATQKFEISTSSAKNKKDFESSRIKGLILCLDDDEWISKVAFVLGSDLDFTDQIDPELKKTKSGCDKELLSKLFKEQISFCATLEKIKDKDNKIQLLSKIYDTSSSELLSEIRLPYDKYDYVDSGHYIADKIISNLTGDSIALTRLAYCKTINPTKRAICVSDYSCKKEREIIKNDTINMAPAWHPWLSMVFYTKFGKTNNCLMSYNLESGKNNIVTSFEGLNMQPSFSNDGKQVALCLSVRGNSEIYLYDQDTSLKVGKRAFKQVTSNNGNNVSPHILPSGNIIFCSDFETKYPQIYFMNMKTGDVNKLTNGGYCANPSFCAKTNQLAYSKSVNGVFQIFVMEIDDSGKVIKDQQLSFIQGDKQEPCWSPCGKYIAFTYHYMNEGKFTSQIAALNFATKKIRVMTHGKESKSYPAWKTQKHELILS